MGGSDGIGLALVRLLLTRGWQVTGLSRRPSPVEHPGYRHHVVDVATAEYAATVAEVVVAPELSVATAVRV